MFKYGVSKIKFKKLARYLKNIRMVLWQRDFWDGQQL